MSDRFPNPQLAIFTSNRPHILNDVARAITDTNFRDSLAQSHLSQCSVDLSMVHHIAKEISNPFAALIKFFANEPPSLKILLDLIPDLAKHGLSSPKLHSLLSLAETYNLSIPIPQARALISSVLDTLFLQELIANQDEKSTIHDGNNNVHDTSLFQRFTSYRFRYHAGIFSLDFFYYTGSCTTTNYLSGDIIGA